ncbi:hypothetical protein EGW08_000317 [Elysia chlorotica]|uniref:Snurportin-1 n=1 Tax=Elysia chlorotica TaxID=188477 RepID=A0A433UDK4_ELYCH|nr:hypothetical protein EGW08_000317 [Elysia chlorotica]
MSYNRGYDGYGYDDRRGYSGGGWGDDYRGGGGWNDGYRGRYDDGSDRGWDRGRDRNRDRGNYGDGDRRDRDRSFGGRGGGGRGGFNKRGAGGNRGNKRPGSGSSGPPKKIKDDNNWEHADRHQVMQSVYMEAKPENFESEWMFAVCPTGRRRVIVAADETTQSYNSSGTSDAKFKSCLPSGSEAFHEVHKLQDLTVLDTMFDSEAKKCYIIDMMHWRHYPYYDTEADFRFYCLADKYSELKKPTEITENNEVVFLLNFCFSAISRMPNFCKFTDFHHSWQVEGLLFINKTSLYEPKDTSNSLWLRLDKMEEILGFAPPEGLEFEETSSRDERKKKELEERQKLKEQRDAVTKEAQEQLQEDQADATSADKDDNNSENPQGNDDAKTDFTTEDYTTSGAEGNDNWF